MKQCSRCKEEKSLDLFYKANYQKDGYDYYCKFCRVGMSLKSHQGGNKKPCDVDECKKIHYAKGLCRMHYTRMYKNGQLEPLIHKVDGQRTYKYKSQNIKYRREYILMYQYKLPMDKYLEMIEDGCNICGEVTERNLQVDHDHACCSGPITCGECTRGILCNRCNLTVGKYDAGLIRPDNPLLEKVKRYIDGQKR